MTQPPHTPPAPADDNPEVCVCFHVPLGKLVAFFHRHPPRVASGFADCHGAGTGCGWCVPHLEQVFEQLRAGEPPSLAMPPEEYRARRLDYHRLRRPLLPASPDADGPLELDLEEVLGEVDENLRLDNPPQAPD